MSDEKPKRVRAETLPFEPVSAPKIPSLGRPGNTPVHTLPALEPISFKKDSILLMPGPIRACFMILSGIVEEQVRDVTSGWRTHRSLGHFRVIGAEFLCANESARTSFRYIATVDSEVLKFDNESLLRKIAGKDLGRNTLLTPQLIERQRVVIESLAREAVNAEQDRHRSVAQLNEENQFFLTAIDNLHAEIAYSNGRRKEGATLLRRAVVELQAEKDRSRREGYEKGVSDASKDAQNILSQKDDEIAALKARIKSLEEAPSNTVVLNSLPPDVLSQILDGLNELGTRISGVDQKVTKIQQGTRTISEQFRLGTRFVADLISFLAATPRESHAQLLLPATRTLLESTIPAVQQVGLALEGLLLQSNRATGPAKKPS